jgi:hypothetical protein
VNAATILSRLVLGDHAIADDNVTEVEPQILAGYARAKIGAVVDDGGVTDVEKAPHVADGAAIRSTTTIFGHDGIAYLGITQVGQRAAARRVVLFKG